MHPSRDSIIGLLYVDEDMRPIALDTPQPAAVGGGLPVGATLAVGGVLRATGRGPLRRAAFGRQAQGHVLSCIPARPSP